MRREPYKPPSEQEIEQARATLLADDYGSPADMDRRLHAHAALMGAYAAENRGDYERDVAAALRDICRKLAWMI